MKSLNIQLLHNYVLVKKLDKEGTNLSSGLVLSQDESIAYGEVVAIGRGRLLDDGTMSGVDSIRVGDKIMYKAGGDSLVTINSETYTLIGDVAVIMILNKENV